MYTKRQKHVQYCCCETDFKAYYYNYKQSFKILSKRHQTELSKLVWQLKDEGHIPVIKWSIVCKAKPHSSGCKALPTVIDRKTGYLAGRPRYDLK